MKTVSEKSELLDHGGKPTVRELLANLVFNPVDGTIRLSGERVVMQRAAVGAELRRQLVSVLGEQEARIFLMRLGFLSGRADARFVRARWPTVDVRDAFTTGTRLHTFSGVVRVDTAHFQLDISKKRFSAEFIWHDSVEAEEFCRHHQQTSEPVCWTQIGYASGYASEFFDDLVIYKETQCRAEGHKHCRVVGKTADMWGPGDPEVILYRERVAASSEQKRSEPLRALALRTAESGLSDLDRIVLAPVREELDRFGAMALPVLIMGAAGTGRARSANYLHRISHPTGGRPRQIDGAQVNDGICAEISSTSFKARKTGAAETLIIDGVQRVPPEMQARLARSLEDGLLSGGPRVIALLDDATEKSAEPALDPVLWYALSALSVRMPSLADRPVDRLAIARALLPTLAMRMGRPAVELDAEAAELVSRTGWPGNLRQMRAVLSAALVEHRQSGPITGGAIKRLLERRPLSAYQAGEERSATLLPLETVFSATNFSMPELEREVYEAAVARANGNVSAAARLLGITRAQLAYRLGSRSAHHQSSKHDR